MDLPFASCVCVHKQVHSGVPALLLDSAKRRRALMQLEGRPRRRRLSLKDSLSLSRVVQHVAIGMATEAV